MSNNTTMESGNALTRPSDEVLSSNTITAEQTVSENNSQYANDAGLSAIIGLQDTANTASSYSDVSNLAVAEGINDQKETPHLSPKDEIQDQYAIEKEWFLIQQIFVYLSNIKIAVLLIVCMILHICTVYFEHIQEITKISLVLTNAFSCFIVTQFSILFLPHFSSCTIIEEVLIAYNLYAIEKWFLIKRGLGHLPDTKIAVLCIVYKILVCCTVYLIENIQDITNISPILTNAFSHFIVTLFDRLVLLLFCSRIIIKHVMRTVLRIVREILVSCTVYLIENIQDITNISPILTNAFSHFIVTLFDRLFLLLFVLLS